jgi:hypothetical protein
MVELGSSSSEILHFHDSCYLSSARVLEAVVHFRRSTALSSSYLDIHPRNNCNRPLLSSLCALLLNYIPAWSYPH